MNHRAPHQQRVRSQIVQSFHACECNREHLLNHPSHLLIKAAEWIGERHRTQARRHQILLRSDSYLRAAVVRRNIRQIRMSLGMPSELHAPCSPVLDLRNRHQPHTLPVRRRLSQLRNDEDSCLVVILFKRRKSIADKIRAYPSSNVIISGFRGSSSPFVCHFNHCAGVIVLYPRQCSQRIWRLNLASDTVRENLLVTSLGRAHMMVEQRRKTRWLKSCVKFLHDPASSPRAGNQQDTFASKPK